LGREGCRDIERGEANEPVLTQQTGGIRDVSAGGRIPGDELGGLAEKITGGSGF
jgi:hypothetical protein